MGHRKFCIVTTARCGSNLLRSLLHYPPDAVCHGELFSAAGVFTVFEEDAARPISVEDRDRDPLGFLASVEQKTFEQAGTCGFKLFIQHNRVVLRHVQQSPEYRVVILFRRNLLAQYSSREIARTSGIWQMRGAADGPQHQIRFDQEAFMTFAAMTRRRYARVRSRLAAAGRQCFEMEYLDVSNERVIEALIDFIGAGCPPQSVRERIRMSPYVKQNAKVIIDRFSNPAAVVRTMQAIGQESWLGEEKADCVQR